jgi:hypothetical protein
MIQSTKSSLQSASEIVAFHKVRRVFLSLTDMEKENPDEFQICEFKGQDFELIVDCGLGIG